MLFQQYVNDDVIIVFLNRLLMFLFLLFFVFLLVMLFPWFAKIKLSAKINLVMVHKYYVLFTIGKV